MIRNDADNNTSDNDNDNHISDHDAINSDDNADNPCSDLFSLSFDSF